MEAQEWCRKYQRSNNTKDLTQAWDLYYHVFRRISKQLPQVSHIICCHRGTGVFIVSARFFEIWQHFGYHVAAFILNVDMVFLWWSFASAFRLLDRFAMSFSGNRFLWKRNQFQRTGQAISLEFRMEILLIYFERNASFFLTANIFGASICVTKIADM